MIYGVATLSGCMLCGSLLGNLLGLLTGTNSDIGGVGFSMLLLILVSNWKSYPLAKQKGFADGIEFWKAMYIPVVIAMSASQNVYQALSGGTLAIIAGIVAVMAAFALLPLLNKLASNNNAEEKSHE